MHTSKKEDDNHADLSESMEGRGVVSLTSQRITSMPLKFFTEEAYVDASIEFLTILLARAGHGAIKRDTKAELVFVDAALFTGGRELYDRSDELRFVEPWMIAELIYASWGYDQPPLLSDQPNWFFLPEGLVSVALRSDGKWGVDIRSVEKAMLESGARVFAIF